MNSNDFNNYLDDITSLFCKVATKYNDTKSDDAKYELKDLTPTTISSHMVYPRFKRCTLVKNDEAVVGLKIVITSEKVSSIEVNYVCNLKSVNHDGETYKIVYKSFHLDEDSSLWEYFNEFDANRYIIFVDLEGLADEAAEKLKDEDYYVDGRLDVPELPSVLELVYRKDDNSISLGGVQ